MRGYVRSSKNSPKKANEGQLSPSERDEYAAYVRAIDLVSILQSKARRFLAQREFE